MLKILYYKVIYLQYLNINYVSNKLYILIYNYYCKIVLYQTKKPLHTIHQYTGDLHFNRNNILRSCLPTIMKVK